MKYFTLFLFLILLGYAYNPKPRNLFIRAQIDEKEAKPVTIEINSVPPPFDLGGNDPYVAWMNGRKVDLPKEDLIKLVNKVGEENIPDLDPADIHKGWLHPHHAKREGFSENTGRTRQLKNRIQ